MINRKSQIVFLLIALASIICSPMLRANSDQAIDDKITKQMKFPRVRGWCTISWNDQQYTGMILDLDEDQATIKIFDTEAQFSEWPTAIFPIKDIKPCTFEKCYDLDGLISSLKSTNRLKTPAIEVAVREIDRAWFCPEFPYYDTGIEIGHDMFISAPHIHVLSLELCKDLFASAQAVLDVGSGSGYLTALFSKLAPKAEVIGIDCFEDLIVDAEKTISNHLPSALSSRIRFMHGNGEKGHLAMAPYTIIYVGFMCKEVPQDLLNQLAPGGKLLIPLGTQNSTYSDKCLAGSLFIFEKLLDGTIKQHEIFSCSFVPSIERP